MSCNLKEYKEFIDNEMLLILGQMDKATLIFDHVYLVSFLISHFYCLTVILNRFLSLCPSLFLRRGLSGTLPTWRNYVSAGELIVNISTAFQSMC